jgi:putative transcriptional regulator
MCAPGRTVLDQTTGYPYVVNMTTTIVKIRKSDGKLVRIHPDGREEVLRKRPIRPMTDEEIEAAARSDPDNPPR